MNDGPIRIFWGILFLFAIGISVYTSIIIIPLQTLEYALNRCEQLKGELFYVGNSWYYCNANNQTISVSFNNSWLTEVR